MIALTKDFGPFHRDLCGNRFAAEDAGIMGIEPG